jgi:ABC-type branched-subunit amino acid transport system ATPase component
VIATHDVGMARAVCGRTIVLDEGVVIADGPTGAVLDDPALAAAYGLDEAGIHAG